jgi:curved DNA-binding protein CbpA
MDPYAILRLDRSASWEEILTAYRRQVRWWHPDGLVRASDAERRACEQRIRALNAAYHELRVRRGR